MTPILSQPCRATPSLIRFESSRNVALGSRRILLGGTGVAGGFVGDSSFGLQLRSLGVDGDLGGDAMVIVRFLPARGLGATAWIEGESIYFGGPLKTGALP